MQASKFKLRERWYQLTLSILIVLGIIFYVFGMREEVQHVYSPIQLLSIAAFGSLIAIPLISGLLWVLLVAFVWRATPFNERAWPVYWLSLLIVQGLYVFIMLGGVVRNAF
jgi:hypothetical protein